MTNLYDTDQSGIHTLGGFSYQIRVFAYYLATLEANTQLEFETYDDVTVRKLNSNSLDLHADNFKNVLMEQKSMKAIQVKRTKLDNETALKVLMNWMLLEASESVVSKYILFTSDEYNNKNNLFHKTAQELFLEIDKEELKVKPRSIKGKLKKQFNNKLSSFCSIYDSVNNKVEFVSVGNIDDEILKAYEILFRRAGLNNDIVYIQRIKALLEKLTFEILEMINSKNPYFMKQTDFMKLIEKISLAIKDDDPILSFIDFKQTCNEFDIDDKVIHTREYKQLESCNLQPSLLKSHIIYMQYYGRFRLLYAERGKAEQVEEIEDTTYANFSMVKQRLQMEDKDKPFYRLDQTKKESNSYASNEQLKWGSAVFLTKETTKAQKKISWKEE
ncbi:hypothetical protein [Bacillus paranthracis]|uniref:hypothetical protein n=1 Tax=Bacillus paranthracis TaxID=2026186 RepID=UPI002FDC43C2